MREKTGAERVLRERLEKTTRTHAVRMAKVEDVLATVNVRAGEDSDEPTPEEIMKLHPTQERSAVRKAHP